jgi:chromosome segregation ATPase
VTVLPKEAILPTPEPTPEPLYETTQRYWQDRANVIRTAIDTDQRRIAELQEKIGQLRDDRGVNNAMDPNREQSRQAAIADAQAELERVRADLDRQRQAMSDLEDEARRKSIPPGWLREQ